MTFSRDYVIVPESITRLWVLIFSSRFSNGGINRIQAHKTIRSIYALRFFFEPKPEQNLSVEKIKGQQSRVALCSCGWRLVAVAHL